MAGSTLGTRLQRSLNRASTWIINFLPIRMIRLCWLAMWHRDDVLKSVTKEGWLPFGIRPLAFFASAAVAFAFGVSLNPAYKSEVTWFDVLTSIDTHDAAIVWVELGLPADLLKDIYLEDYFRGASEASSAIKAKVGSEDGMKFAIYVGTLDSRLGPLLAKKVLALQRIESYEDKTMALTLPFIFQIAIVPLYLLGNTLRKSFIQTRNVWLAMQATWFLPGALIAALGRFVPVGHNISSLVFAFFEGMFLICVIVYHYKGFHLTHGISKPRFVFSVVLGFAAMVALVVAVQWSVDAAGHRFENYFARVHATALVLAADVRAEQQIAAGAHESRRYTVEPALWWGQ